MFTQYETLRLTKELRLFFILTQRLLRNTARIALIVLSAFGAILYLLITPPVVKRRHTLEDGEGHNVSLPSQSARWVFGQMPVGIDRER